jgi:apolipoprotein D and lipocalin family protein
MRPSLLRLLLPALLACAVLPAYAQTPQDDTALPNDAVPAVDLQRYAGHWYEIAHLPMYFQRKCVADTTAEYTPQTDGMMAVRNRCRTEDGSFQQVDGEARRVGESTSKLEVRFAPGWMSWLPMVWGDYWVIALDEDYQWAMVGSPKADYLWILSRSDQLDAGVRNRLIEQARRMGYPVDKVEITPQRSQQP